MVCPVIAVIKDILTLQNWKVVGMRAQRKQNFLISFMKKNENVSDENKQLYKNMVRK